MGNTEEILSGIYKIYYIPTLESLAKKQGRHYSSDPQTNLDIRYSRRE